MSGGSEEKEKKKVLIYLHCWAANSVWYIEPGSDLQCKKALYLQTSIVYIILLFIVKISMTRILTAAHQ